MTISLAINANVRGQGSVDRLNRSVRDVGGTAQIASRAFRALGAALAGVSFIAVAREATRASDAIKSLNAQLVSTGSNAALAAQQVGRVAQIAQATGSSFNDVADIFARLQRSTRELGTTTQEIATASTAIQQSFRLAGSTTAEASSAALQLSQGLASGVLRGEEFRAINENNQVLIQAIAREMGVLPGSLRELAEEGKLTREVVFRAILNDAENINEQFANFGNLYGQSATRIANASRLILGEIGTIFDEITDINDGIANITQSITDAFEQGRVRRAILDFTAFVRLAFAGIRDNISGIFGAIGIDISDGLNAGLSAFAIGAGALVAIRTAGIAAAIAFRGAFAIASAPARLIRAFAGGIRRQVANTNLGRAGTALSNSLRAGFSTRPLVPTIAAPSAAAARAVGATTSQRVDAGLRPSNVLINPIPRDAARAIGRTTSARIRNGLTTLVAPVSSISAAAGRLVGERSTERVRAGIRAVVQPVTAISALAARGIGRTTSSRVRAGMTPVTVPVTGGPLQALRGIGGNIASSIAAGIGAFGGWMVGNYVAESFNLEPGSFSAIGIAIAGSIIGSITAELAVSLASRVLATVTSIFATGIAIPVLTVAVAAVDIIFNEAEVIRNTSRKIADIIAAATGQGSVDEVLDSIRSRFNEGLEEGGDLTNSALITTQQSSGAIALFEDGDLSNGLELFNQRLNDLNEDYIPNVFQQQIAIYEDAITRITDELTRRASGGEQALGVINAPGFQNGGYINGPGSGTSDSILARVSNGEFVINAKSTEEYFPLIQAINNGSLPRFQTGGLVGDTAAQRRLTGLTDSRDQTQERIADYILQLNQAVLDGNRYTESTITDLISMENDELDRLNGLIETQTQVIMNQDAEGRQTTESFNAESEVDKFINSFKSSLSTAFSTGDFGSFLDSVADQFSMQVISNFVDGLVDNLFSGALTDALTGIFSGANSIGGSIGTFLGGFFHNGGVIPGQIGEQVPIIAQAGERVIPANEARNGGGEGMTITVNNNISGDVTEQTRREVVRMTPELINATQATFEERRLLSNA